MYTAGLSDAYGYGRVYREYPQAPFQQVARPGAGDPPIRFPALGAWQPGIMDGPNPAAVWAMNNRRLSILAVGAPATEAATVLPWTVESAHGAAIHRKDNVTYLARAQSFPVTDQPVKFPFLGQWWPHFYDVPDPMPTVDNWVNRLEHLPVGDPPIPFPALGAWRPGSMAPPDPQAIWNQLKLPAALAYPDTQAKFPTLGAWQPGSMDGADPRAIWAQVKLPKNREFVALTPAWTWETKHSASVQRLDEVIYLASPRNLPIGNLPVAFPSLGAWQPHNYDAPDLGAVALTYLQGRQVLPAGAAPVPFPKLGQWSPKLMDGPDPLPVWTQLKLPKNTEFISLTAPWLSELDHHAALQRFDEVLYLVRPQSLPAGNPAVPFPFLGKWQPGAYDVPDLGAVSRTYLQELQIRPVGADPVAFPKRGQWQPASMDAPSPLPAWLQHTGPNPRADLVQFIGPWQEELQNIAALHYKGQVVYLPRRGFGDGPPLNVTIVPALLGRANWAALNATQEVIYLVRYPYGKSTGRLQVYDSVAGVWRTSLHIWVYDAGAAQWRLVDNLWVFDSSANTWRLSY